MPERHLTPCKSGKHKLPAIRYTLVSPARHERVELTEANIHEVLEHGGKLPANVVEFLQQLSEEHLPTKLTEGSTPLSLKLMAIHATASGIRLDIVAANTSSALYKLCLTQPYLQLRSNHSIEIELSCYEKGQGKYLAPCAELTDTLWLQFGQAIPVLERTEYSITLSVRSDVDNVRAEVTQQLSIEHLGSGVNVLQVVELARTFLRADNSIVAFQDKLPVPTSSDKRTRVSLESWAMGSTSTHWELSFSNHGPELYGSTSVSVAKQGELTSDTKRLILE